MQFGIFEAPSYGGWERLCSKPNRCIFTSVGPKFWNALDDKIKSAPSLMSFKFQIKIVSLKFLRVIRELVKPINFQLIIPDPFIAHLTPPPLFAHSELAIRARFLPPFFKDFVFINIHSFLHCHESYSPYHANLSHN